MAEEILHKGILAISSFQFCDERYACISRISLMYETAPYSVLGDKACVAKLDTAEILTLVGIMSKCKFGGLISVI